MIQIKNFKRGVEFDYDYEMEIEVNKFLEENDGRINLKDIKITYGDCGCRSVLVIYETI